MILERTEEREDGRESGFIFTTYNSYEYILIFFANITFSN
jgi:hypothetical protein